MQRRLVAALACRNNGSRLYGKPMQKLLGEVTILDQIILSIKRIPFIDEIVLGISEGADNQIFVEVAARHGVSHLFGDPRDVLSRLVQCGRQACATDIFRVTTECPWFAHEILKDSWKRHVDLGMDITICDEYPEGINFEIYTLAALEKSHANGGEMDRSEFCSNYARTHPGEFRIEVVRPPSHLRRLDLRVTVDNPEDLILCRAIADALSDEMPLVPTEKIVAFIDSRPDLQALVRPYVVPEEIWKSAKVGSAR
jgi:spore coat polysaccharide biosynthesis protein SpsF